MLSAHPSSGVTKPPARTSRSCPGPYGGAVGGGAGEVSVDGVGSGSRAANTHFDLNLTGGIRVVRGLGFR